MHLLRRHLPEQFPILAFNPAATRAGLGSEYIEAVRRQDNTDPIIVETQPTLPDYEASLAAGVDQYLHKTDGALPKNITVIGGDKVVGDTTAIMHAKRTAAHVSRLDAQSPVAVALTDASIAVIPAGNGNDRARELLLPKSLRNGRFPMPWEWPLRRQLFPIELTRTDPTGESHCGFALNYAGLGASALLLQYIAAHRDEWKQLTAPERIRRELMLALRFAHESDITVNGKRLAGFDIVCASVMAKRIVTGTRPDVAQLKVIETPRRTRMEVALMAGKLAIGKPPEGTIVNNGICMIDGDNTPHYVDGDYIGSLASGTTLTYASSGIWVPFDSQR